MRLASYLHTINRADEPECSCGWERETVRHVLLECERWFVLRTKTRCPEDLKKILHNPELVQKASKFMVQTGLLGQFRTVQAAPDEDPA